MPPTGVKATPELTWCSSSDADTIVATALPCAIIAAAIASRIRKDCQFIWQPPVTGTFLPIGCMIGKRESMA